MIIDVLTEVLPGRKLYSLNRQGAEQSHRRGNANVLRS